MRFIKFLISLGGMAFAISVTEYWADAKNMLNEIHPNLTPILLAVIVSIAVVAYVIGVKKDNSDKREFCKKIHDELMDTLNSLNGMLGRETKEVIIDNKKIHYKHVYLNYLVFDTSINSGEFNLIKSNLQQSIQDIYGKIKIHDEFVRKIVNIELDPEQILVVPDDYYIILNKHEKEMLQEIPVILTKLICTSRRWL